MLYNNFEIFLVMLSFVMFLAGVLLGSLMKVQILFQYAYIDFEEGYIDEVIKHFTFHPSWNSKIKIRQIDSFLWLDKDGKEQHIPGCIRVSKPFWDFSNTRASESRSSLPYLEEIAKSANLKIINRGQY